jgi:hypothetical protein
MAQTHLRLWLVEKVEERGEGDKEEREEEGKNRGNKTRPPLAHSLGLLQILLPPPIPTLIISLLPTLM